MIKFLKYTPILLLLLPAAMQAQNTQPLSNVFPIRTTSTAFSTGQLLGSTAIRAGTGALSVWAYPIDGGDAVDSVWFPAAYARAQTGEVRYTVEVIRLPHYGYRYDNYRNILALSDTLITVRVRKQTYTGADTTFVTTVMLNRCNRTVIDSLGWKFVRSRVSVGDKFEVDLTYDKPLQAVERTTGALTTVSVEQAKLNQGDHYFVSFDSVLAAAGDSLKVVVITPNTTLKDLHLVYTVESSDTSVFVLREAVTHTAGDTVTIFNSNRNSSNTSGAKVIGKAATITAAGTLLRSSLLGYYRAGSTISTERKELILARNTKYAFCVIANHPSRVNLSLYWYESGDRE